MFIDGVLVDRAHRRRGYGKEIMREAIEFARREDVDSVELAVNDDNKIARDLYQKLGFLEMPKKYCRRILRTL
jgi:ribosomal protein S18 acetylase RimI-like enzyme